MANPLEGMGFSVANKMVDSIFNEHAANKAFSRQKALMQMQNAFAVENWNRENAYNTPERQKERLIAAGINPDMMYGQSGVASMANGIAAPTAPSSQMAAVGTTDLATAVQAISAAKKMDSEKIGQDIENYVQNLIKDERIKQIALQNHWTEEQTQNIREATAKLSHEIANLVGQNNLLQKNGELVDAEIVYKKMRTLMEGKQMAAQIERWKHENKLTDAEAKQIKDMLPQLILGQKLANGQSALDFLMDSEFRDAERRIGVIERFCRLIGTAFGGSSGSRRRR